MLAFFLSSFVTSILLKPNPLPFHFESFGDANWVNQWQVTTLPNYTGVWELRQPAKPLSFPEEKMIFMANESSYYGLSTKFDTPLDLTDQTLVVQYEVRAESTIECGGAYIKLFGTENFDSPSTLSNETRYVIMFGPDKCGDTDKVHFIFRHLEPSGKYEEKHMTDAPIIKNNKINHLYTLIVRPDNSFDILIDGSVEKSGNLLNDFDPPVNPPKEIDDPTDHKPADWVDEEMIDDPDAKKPDDWDEDAPEYIPDPEKLDPPEGWLVDEPRFVPDPNAQRPDDWDEDIHGEWEPPTIANPKCDVAPGCGEYEPPLIPNENYKGKWEAPQIENPLYKGEWKPRQIPNPNYYEDPNPHNFRPIAGAGFELWMVNKDVGFENVYIGTDEGAVKTWNDQHFLAKHAAQENEQQKLEPEPTPDPSVDDNDYSPESNSPTLHNSGEGFESALKDFILNIKEAWISLYEENKEATLAVSAFMAFIPLTLIYTCIFCREKPKPRRKKGAKKKGKKAAKKKDAEKQAQENAEEHKEENPEEHKEENPEEHKEENPEEHKEENAEEQ